MRHAFRLSLALAALLYLVGQTFDHVRVGVAFAGCFVVLVSQASSPDYRALWWFCLPCACAILVASLGYGLLVKAPVRWVSVEVVCSHPGSVLEGNQVANLQPIHTRRFLDQAQRRRRSTSLVVLHR